MAEYIEREAVMQKFADHVKRSNNSDFVPTPTWNQAVQIVEDIPAADVQPVKHGHWIINLIEPYGSYCSCCGFAWYDHIDAVKLNPVLSKIETNYCPNCGATMEVDDG